MFRIKLPGMLSCILSLLLCIFFPGIEVFADDAAEEEKTLLYAETPVTEFRVGNLSPTVSTDLDYTDWWYSEWEDCHYLFLPATADRDFLTITCSAGDVPLSLNGTPVISGEMTGILGSADEFTVTAGDTDCGTLRILQSNLGSIYLATSTGGLDYLDKHQKFTETAYALMVNADGGTEYAGALEKITKHGNSSWDYSKKKPYNFKLPAKADLFGMGKAKKWTLLSNYLDHSLLRNKATLEMSRAAGMEYVMDSVFVDLYADGSYRGTYQLIERVQIQKNRVNITDLEEETEKLNDAGLETYPQIIIGTTKDQPYMENSYKFYDIPNDPKDISGGYLIEFVPWNRYYDYSSGFVTSRGQAINLKCPEYASGAQVEYIRQFVQELEDAIYSPSGYNMLGKHYSEYIDVDSLVTAYLIQEITKNADGTFASFFFWKESDKKGDGRIHCGPAWDFDLSFNNFIRNMTNSDGDLGTTYQPEGLLTPCFPISGYDEDLTDNDGSGRPTLGIGWIGQLYKRGDIVRRSAEIYFERFVPYLDALTDTGREGGALLTQMAEDVRPSAEMNNARWHTYGGREYLVFGYSSGADYRESVDILRNFMEKRSTWLKEFWEPELTKNVRGDVSGDGLFSLTDLIMLQKWLLRAKTDLPDSEAADLYEDGVIDILDLAMMKKELMHQ